MSIRELLTPLLELDDVQSIDRLEWSLAAPWAHEHPTLLLWGCLALVTVVVCFYRRLQPRHHPRTRWVLAFIRGFVLSLLLLFLADPVIVVRLTHTPHPWLWIVFDGTESMAIADEYPEAERERLREATGVPGNVPRPLAASAGRPSRLAHVQALLRKTDGNPIRDLAAKYRLKAFVLDRPDGVREIGTTAAGEPFDPGVWADRLAATGQVTALGRAFEDLALRRPPGPLAGLLVFSDFDQNSGPPAVAAALRLAAPVSTVGIGARAATDIAVDLQTPLLLKKAERATLVALLRGSDAADRSTTVTLTARRISDSGADKGAPPLVIGERSVRFYRDVLGFEVKSSSPRAAFLRPANVARACSSVIAVSPMTIFMTNASQFQQISFECGLRRCAPHRAALGGWPQ
jgi:hypothetical protein